MQQHQQILFLGFMSTGMVYTTKIYLPKTKVIPLEVTNRIFVNIELDNSLKTTVIYLGW